MLRRWFFRLLIVLIGISLSGCVGGLWTGASLVYDRHGVYKKLDDYQLFLKVNNALAVGRVFQCTNCVIDLAIFNGDILIAGHLPTSELVAELNQRMSTIHRYRRLFNAMQMSNTPSNALQDSWITTKIRSQIFADETIDPNAFKIVTSDGIVYLMGDVHPDEAEKVITISRRTAGVIRVVKILKYFTYGNSPGTSS
jgi:osmotically-inducible protein OsmY